MADITARGVLTNVNKYIAEIESAKQDGWHKRIYISDVCGELSIFDWFKDNLSLAKLKQMRSFLKTAIAMGYDGHVCFKVGSAGTANGMWAFKELSDTGYSPDSDCIYRSFTPDYSYWQVRVGDKWYPNADTDGQRYDSITTKKDFLGYAEQVLTKVA